MKKCKMSLMEITARFHDDETAEKWFIAQRWPDGVTCPRCDSDRVKEKVNGRGKRAFRCNDCRRDFTTKTDSSMVESNIGYRKWAIAIYLLMVNVKGTTSTKLASDLGITQKSAWYMAMRIREAYFGSKDMHETIIQGINDTPENVAKAMFPNSRPASFKSRLLRGDCLKVLRTLPLRQKFDVIIADPPYNIGKDFGNDSDKMPMADYLEWTDEWLSLCLKLLAKNGVAYVYGFPEILARVAAKYPINEQRWLAWHYTNKTVPSSKFWQRSHESILCLWKPGQNRPTLEVDQIREDYTDGYKINIGRPRAGTDSRFNGGKGKETVYQDYGGALPRDVIKIPALAGGAGASERWFMCRDCNNKVFPPSEINNHRDHEIMKHPTQKPMALTKRLLLSRVNGNRGRCLIPFAGSGSECVVAASLGIEWLGIELNLEYVSFAKKWMKKCIR